MSCSASVKIPCATTPLDTIEQVRAGCRRTVGEMRGPKVEAPQERDAGIHRQILSVGNDWPTKTSLNCSKSASDKPGGSSLPRAQRVAQCQRVHHRIPRQLRSSRPIQCWIQAGVSTAFHTNRRKWCGAKACREGSARRDSSVQLAVIRNRPVSHGVLWLGSCRSSDCVVFERNWRIPEESGVDSSVLCR